jgi:MFS family permease
MAEASAAPAGPTVEEALAWEREQRARAGFASIAAGILLFATFVYANVAFGDSPTVGLTDGLRDALGRPPSGGLEGLLTESALWFEDHAVELVGVTALSALGTALIALVLGYLFRATHARRPETSRFILYLALVGPILYGTGPLISTASAVLSASSYVSSGEYSTLAAHDALRTGTGISVAQGFVGLGQIATTMAIVLVSLNAMRVGLLTRFVGILGCIVGALIVLSALLGPAAIVQSFWLVALGLLILGRLGAVPLAWSTGRAEPWPSQQALRERKTRAGGAAAAEPERDDAPAAAEADGDATDADAFGRPHPASKKRKRKRR